MYHAPGTSLKSTAEPVLSINSIYSAKYPSQFSIAPDIGLRVQGFLFRYLLVSKSLCIASVTGNSCLTGTVLSFNFQKLP
jgi:hypothetical protein